MEFFHKEHKFLLILCVNQDMEMWESGYLTLDNKGGVFYAKMEELIPRFQSEPFEITKSRS